MAGICWRSGHQQGTWVTSLVPPSAVYTVFSKISPALFQLLLLPVVPWYWHLQDGLLLELSLVASSTAFHQCLSSGTPALLHGEKPLLLPMTMASNTVPLGWFLHYKVQMPAQDTNLASSGTIIQCAYSEKRFLCGFVSIDVVLFLITTSFQLYLTTMNCYCKTNVSLSGASLFIITASSSATTDHNQFLNSRYYINSSDSLCFPLKFYKLGIHCLSAFLSTFLASKHPQTGSSIFKGSMGFQSPSTIL